MASIKSVTTDKKAKSYCEKFSISQQDLYLAIIIAWGVRESDAMEAVFKLPESKGEAMWQRYVKAHQNTLSCIDEIKKENRKKSSEGSMYGVYNLRDKDGVIDALTSEARDAKDPKQRAEIILRIADLQKMKNEEDKKKHKLIFYYLPLRCEVCPFKCGKTTSSK